MMKKKTTTPHDAVFRQMLSRVETARDFMALHLPAELKALCQLDTLRLESSAFIEDDLRPYYSDVLYSLKTSVGEGYIHVLIEHQSSPDRNMAFRLLRYAVAIMQRHLDAGHKSLPLVIPILFYQGKRSPYPYSLNWLDAFRDPLLARRLYGEAFPLVDITVIPDDEIMHHRSMAMLTLLQKHIRQRDLAELLQPLVILLNGGYTDEQQLTTLVHYMVQAGETRNPGEFLASLAVRVPEHEDTLMTIADWLHEQGRQEGEQKGIQKGIQEGRQEGIQDVARSLLQMGLPLETIVEATGLSEQTLRQLCR